MIVLNDFVHEQTTSSGLLPVEVIERRISLIRGHKVLLDTDLAELYQVPTKRSTKQ